MRRGFTLFCCLLLFWSMQAPAWSLPTQFGNSGLLTQPNADTLNSGNICLGVWGDLSGEPDKDVALLPVAITLGLGNFLEAYGSYPNLLFNGDEDDSPRGFANVGFKIRFFGRRSANFRLALDGQAHRRISDDAQQDGLTDLVGRLVASYKFGRLGLHLNGGYALNESTDDFQAEDQVVYGGAIEFYPTNRLRLIAEAEAATERFKDEDGPVEAMAGFQYFLSPHLTFNLGVGAGFSDASPDWRVLVGFTTCQGVGTYSRPLPKVIAVAEATPEETEATKPKVIKLKALTPLLPTTSLVPPAEGVAPLSQTDAPPAVETEGKGKIRALSPLVPTRTSRSQSAPLGRLEVPVEDDKQREVMVSPEERLDLSQVDVLKSLPISPIASLPAFAVRADLEEPVAATVYRRFRLSEFSFEVNQWSLSAEGKQALAEVAEQLREDQGWLFLRIEGHTDSVGSAAYNQDLSLRRAVAAASYLVVHTGIDPVRMFVRGVGEEEPIAPNDDPEGRARNRRIELLVLAPAKEKP